MRLFIPSPDHAVWHLGPVPIRAYALCIVAGAVVAIWIGEKRYVARGGESGVISDLAVWVIPSGIVGARIWHVVSHWQDYTGPGTDLLDVFKVWEGGIAIFGAIAGGALGGWLALRNKGVSIPLVLDSLAPGIPVAQAMGRFGNYFNQELFGRPTTLPWGLEIDEIHRPPGFEQFATFHPTFAYEAIWNLTAAVLILALDRRHRFTRGRAFLLYLMLYAVGRFWIEALRIDPANAVLGLRLNDWVALAVFTGAAYAFWRTRTPHAHRPVD